jgi:hypothetical protein
LAKPKADSELCVRFAKRDADPDQHVSMIFALSEKHALEIPGAWNDHGGLAGLWAHLLQKGHVVHMRREGTACPMASLARLEAADGLARAKSLSRTPLDDPRWYLRPNPPTSLRIELLKLPHDVADRHGEPEPADTDRARMIRHRRPTLVRTGSICDRQRAVLFGSIVHVEKVGPSLNDWVWHDLGIYPAYLDSPGLRKPLGNDHHLLRIVHGRRSSVFHFHAIATAKVAREMANLDPQALDNICWALAGIVTPIFYLGDKTWTPTFTR